MQTIHRRRSERCRSMRQSLKDTWMGWCGPSVEETLNPLLEAEADQICDAERYERSADRVDTRAGHYERKLETKAGTVTLKIPK